MTLERFAAAPRDEQGEREEVEGESEEDNLERTFASGTILTHFLVIDDLERRRSGVVADFDFVPADSVPSGETQQEVVRSAGDSSSDVPVSVTFFAVRTGRGVAVAVAVAVYVGGRKRRLRLEATATALSSKLASVGVVDGAGEPASESGMAMATLRVSQADCAFWRLALIFCGAFDGVGQPARKGRRRDETRRDETRREGSRPLGSQRRTRRVRT